MTRRSAAPTDRSWVSEGPVLGVNVTLPCRARDPALTITNRPSARCEPPGAGATGPAQNHDEDRAAAGAATGMGATDTDAGGVLAARSTKADRAITAMTTPITVRRDTRGAKTAEGAATAGRAAVGS